MRREAEARRQAGTNEAETGAPGPDQAAKKEEGARARRQSPLMAGKRGLVMGVANERSIAWGLASALHKHGAELAFTYQGEIFGSRVRPLAESLGSSLVMPCDVAREDEIEAVFAALDEAWDGLDFVVHALAFSDKEELKGRYLDTSRANFARTLEISCYSFTAVAQRAAPMMVDGGGLLTLTYLGAERVTPNYNVMGVAKAALEASVRYLAVDLGDRGIRVSVYSAATPLDASDVARGVTETLMPSVGSSTLAIPLGLGIHMVLAVILGIALTAVLRSAEARLGGALPQLGMSVGILLVIWAVNFLVVLPELNPAFVSLLPYAVSAASKTLFGLTVVAVYRFGRWEPPQGSGQGRAYPLDRDLGAGVRLRQR